MKKLLFPCFPIFLFILFNNIKAQTELWGMTSEGGYSKGVIFKTDSSGSNYSIQHYFENREKNPKGSLIKASNGKYYGMSDNGGNYGLGCILEYDSSSDSVFILHHFDGEATGSHPKGDMLEASNGKLYGMTNTGGTGNNRGVVFELDLSDNTFTKIYEFGEYPLGRLPYGSLIEATNGKLYGMTRDGGYLGAGGSGTIFKLDLSGPTLTFVHTFNNTDGLHPLGNLLQVNDSLLYGVTPEGGTGGQGTVFKFNIDIDKHTKLYDFDGITGSAPRGTPVEATDGSLYGLFNGGSGDSYNGGIFEYDIDDSTLINKYNFGWSQYHPSTGGVLGSLIEGESNMLFGMTNRGGSKDDGAMFKFNCSSGTFTKLYDFDFDDPQNNDNVFGSLVESSPGKYLGMTNVDGTTGKGTIFEYDTTTTTYTIKHGFNSYSHGENPKGSLLAASNGKFYGLTVTGGKYNAGTLFEYDRFAGVFYKMHDFDGAATGANPNGTLIEATNGKIYGLTKWGGVNDWQGTLFEFDSGTGILTKLHDFAYAPAAGQPIGSLVQASNGKLYGMSSFGGAHFNRGTLFEYDISTNTFTVKHNFYNDGSAPEGNLIETKPGILYGLTRTGGTNNQGTIFEYEISTGTLATKHNLSNDNDGREPKGDLIMATNGKLYGLASNGGANSQGTVFEYDTTAAGTFTKVHDFIATSTGKFSYGSLVESSDGNLYGMTGGGTDATYYGTLFQVDTSTNSVTKIQDFNYTNGSKPQYTQLIKIVVHADWTGAVSSDWHNPANWLQNAVPDPFTEVVIPDVSVASGNFPVVISNTKVRKLTIDDNATLSVQTGIVFQIGNQ